ncbi:uncharacterized protein Dmoj_GI26007 [Drosophila mojavensis]|uniref:Uncharacterized protein n=1 Tax=Drosophila mojavensis TaxID=7230 RepID=A0A0Q9X9E9_DROMO|nr:uncharacterized protein Dmoj_GI26007 [Drosophila mojavensis]
MIAFLAHKNLKLLYFDLKSSSKVDLKIYFNLKDTHICYICKCDDINYCFFDYRI